MEKIDLYIISLVVLNVLVLSDDVKSIVSVGMFKNLVLNLKSIMKIMVYSFVNVVEVVKGGDV